MSSKLKQYRSLRPSSAPINRLNSDNESIVDGSLPTLGHGNAVQQNSIAREVQQKGSPLPLQKSFNSSPQTQQSSVSPPTHSRFLPLASRSAVIRDYDSLSILSPAAGQRKWFPGSAKSIPQQKSSSAVSASKLSQFSSASASRVSSATTANESPEAAAGSGKISDFLHQCDDLPNPDNCARDRLVEIESELAQELRPNILLHQIKIQQSIASRKAYETMLFQQQYHSMCTKVETLHAEKISILKSEMLKDHESAKFHFIELISKSAEQSNLASAVDAVMGGCYRIHNPHLSHDCEGYFDPEDSVDAVDYHHDQRIYILTRLCSIGYWNVCRALLRSQLGFSVTNEELERFKEASTAAALKLQRKLAIDSQIREQHKLEVLKEKQLAKLKREVHARHHEAVTSSVYVEVKSRSSLTQKEKPTTSIYNVRTYQNYEKQPLSLTVTGSGAYT
jgi:hypothetical protein